MDPKCDNDSCSFCKMRAENKSAPTPRKLTGADVDTVVEALARTGHMSPNPGFMARVTLDVLAMLKEMDK